MSSMLPMIAGTSAMEMSEQLTVTLGSEDYIGYLPPELFSFLRTRFIIPSELVQPDLPLMGDGGNYFKVTFLKKITGHTKDKSFNGVDMPDGTILGKSPFPKQFPFMVMMVWTTRQYGYFDSDLNQMITHCESRDGLMPSTVNAWGASTCKSCLHHPSNRPKWGDDNEKDERCKQKLNVLGIGGDWRDLYVLTVQGEGIINFYADQLGKQLSAAKALGEPYFMKTFMIKTEKDRRGNHQYKVDSVMPTLRRDDNVGSDSKVFWDFKPEEREKRNYVTNAALMNIQRLCIQYSKEFMESGRRNYQQQLEIESGSAGAGTDKSAGTDSDDLDIT